ncbi:hypothetical protein F4861DRAFT_481573 [Xylaria intraflava]|nr:hypothetical protein F4861DRAFT_481573 [Xylaria intraflava]
MTEDPTTFITGFPSNITSSEELPPHPTMTTPLPGSDVESASLSTGSDTTSSSSLSKPASTESSQSINSSVPTKVTHTPLPSDTTDSTSQQAGPTISNTTSTIVGTDKATSGTETYTIISNTTTPATTHATTQTASQTVSSSDLTQLPPHSNSTSVEYTTPFTNLTKTEDTKTLSPPKTTTLISSSSISKSSYVEVTATSTIPDIKAADPLTDFTRVTTYGNDTVSTISQKVYDVMATSVQFDTSGKPIKTQFVHVIQSAQVTTLRNPLGTPTATVDYYPIESTTTLYDANSTATATLTTTIPKTGEWTTYYDGNDRPFTTVMLLRPIATDGLVGTPTPTITPLARVLEINPLPDAMYVAGHMIPTLLAILVSIPIRILNRTVKMYQGFHVLASEQGASGIDSLYLATTGPASLLSGLRSLRIGHYLLGLTNLLVIFSALTIPFSTEAFKPILKGPRCHDGNKIIQCSVLLGVSLEPAQMLAALLIALLAGIIMVAALLRRWKTGVDRDPWNIADMAQLAAGTDMRKYLERLRRYKSDSVDKMRANMFGLREWEENGTIKYSVLILNQEADDIVQKPVNKVGRSVAFVDSKNVGRQHHRRRLSGDSSPFYMLSSAGRIMLLFLLNAVLAAVIAYAIVAQRSEHLGWQSENAIGARFLFSGAGVLVTYVWGSLFNSKLLLS